MSWEEERVVQGDWPVTCEGQRYQLNRQHEAMSLMRRKVIVRTLREGRVRLVYRGKALKWQKLPAGSEACAGGENKSRWKAACEEPSVAAGWSKERGGSIGTGSRREAARRGWRCAKLVWSAGFSPLQHLFAKPHRSGINAALRNYDTADENGRA